MWGGKVLRKKMSIRELTVYPDPVRHPVSLFLSLTLSLDFSRTSLLSFPYPRWICSIFTKQSQLKLL